MFLLVNIDIPSLGMICLLLTDAFAYTSQTEINVSPWSITHNPKYFSDPWEFKPERWLDPNSTDNKDASRPFLLGPRDCLGRKSVTLSPDPETARTYLPGHIY